MAQPNGLNPVFDTIRGKAKVIDSSGATATLSQGDSGSVALFNRAAGIVYTLPAPKVGTYFDFFTTVSVTSNAYKVITDAGTTFLIGGLGNVDTDSSNAVAAWTGNGSTHVSISMNGTTTGGLLGTNFRLLCVSATQWIVTGTIQGSGTVAPPFSTS